MRYVNCRKMESGAGKRARSSIKGPHPACLASSTTRLLDLGQEVKYFVIPVCLAYVYKSNKLEITTRKDSDD